MDAATLRDAMLGQITMEKAQQSLPGANEALRLAGCTTVNRAAMFLAQIGHESGSLRYATELASGTAYNGRQDLGNVFPGDGPRFRGRGYLQLTGRSNFGAFSRWANAQGLVDSPTYFIDHPEQVADDRWAWISAVYYWIVARPALNSYADAGDVNASTRAVNGGLNGLADRKARWTRALTFGDRLLPTSGGAVTPPSPTYGNLGIRGLDYSAAIIPGSTIKAAGYQFVIRYVDDPNVGLSTKHIRPAEYQDLIAAGVAVYLVFEVGTGDMLAGHDAGVANAHRARAGAAWIGYPTGAPIFMASDMHLTGAQLPAALAYVDGAVSVLGDACGVYGFWELIDACIAQHKSHWFWQAGVSPDPTDAVHVWQRNDTTTTVGGVACDINELRIPLTPEDDMTPEDRAMLTEVRDLLRWVWSQFAGENAEPFKFTGWPSLPAGSGKRLTLVDYGRQADAQLETLKATVAGLVARQAQP